MACYDGPNPVKDDERMAIWKWAKTEGGIDAGVPIEQVSQAINSHFFGGQAKPEWINDILSGRKTPFRTIATDMWKKQYNRRVVTQQAGEISKLKAMGPLGTAMRKIWTFPRTLAVYGHGVVFPITHGGDLAFSLSPSRWATFIKGVGRTYRAAPEFWGIGSKLGGGKAYAGQVLHAMETDAMFDLGLQSGVDMGKASHPSGLISRSYHGAASRAWDMLTVMRFELWKKQMGKFVTPDMSAAQKLDIGTHLAEWANEATGSGKGPVAKTGGDALFGAKLTQSKLNRLTVDPIKTAKTFANWDDATSGERAVAMTRLSGATQYLATKLGFLAVNAGVLAWLNQKDKINLTNPFKSDFLSFKGGGIVGNVPGMQTEVKALAHVLAIAFAAKQPWKWTPEKIAEFQRQSNQELKGEAKFAATAKVGGQYVMEKLTPAIQRGIEIGTGQNFQGRPLPFSSEPGTASKPKVTIPEYIADIGPIPLSGPVQFVGDQLRKGGLSAMNSDAIVKGLIMAGLGAPGFHVREDFAPTATSSHRGPSGPGAPRPRH